jgi:hypothetical protein
MTPRRPPRFAAYLLQLLAPNEPLQGDLDEEYQAGRSRMWYWRQTLHALSGLRPGRVDVIDLFAPQSLFMQFVMLTLVAVCAVVTVKLIVFVYLDAGVRQLLIGPSALRELLRLACALGLAIPIGVAIARVHTRSRGAAVLAFSVIVPAWAFANLFLLDRDGSLNAALPHVTASLVFIAGLLAGGIHVDPLMHARRGGRI